MTDLKALTIDRSHARDTSPRRGRRGGGFGRWIALALIAGAVWLFRAPIGARLDRLRLPQVSVLVVRETSALAASSVTGTAANGYVVASVRAALSADTPGRIIEMNVTEGSVVKAGDVVARLYADEYAADLRQAQAELEVALASVARSSAEQAAWRAQVERLGSDAQAAESDLQAAGAATRLAELALVRAQRLVEVNVQSQQTLDEAQAGRDRALAAENASASRLAAARAAVDQAQVELLARAAVVVETEARVPSAAAARDRAQATLDKTFVRAPFDGVVVLKDAEVGEVVSPNAVGSQSRGSVVTMVDFASLEVQVEVPETSLSAVTLGAPTQIYLDAFPEQPLSGHVERIWPTANRQKATVEVRVAFEAPDTRLRPEMGVRAVFQAAAADPLAQPEEPGILIPSGCLVRVAGQRGVFVLERDTAVFRALELGDERGERVLVRSGLQAGERVVLDPPGTLADGDRVIVEE